MKINHFKSSSLNMLPGRPAKSSAVIFQMILKEKLTINFLNHNQIKLIFKIFPIQYQFNKRTCFSIYSFNKYLLVVQYNTIKSSKNRQNGQLGACHPQNKFDDMSLILEPKLSKKKLTDSKKSLIFTCHISTHTHKMKQEDIKQ